MWCNLQGRYCAREPDAKRPVLGEIVYALRQVELDTPVAEVVRKMGVSEQTFYRWKKQYGGMGCERSGG